MNLTFCSLAIIFVLSSVYLCFMRKNHELFQRFDKLLNHKQQQHYKIIVRERLTIYISGMFLGLLLSIYYYYQSSRNKRDICISVCIVYITKFVFYYVAPKQPLMLYHLTNQGQVKAWADIYTEMKKRCLHSFIFGTCGYIFSCLAFH